MFFNVQQGRSNTGSRSENGHPTSTSGNPVANNQDVTMIKKKKVAEMGNTIKPGAWRPAKVMKSENHEGYLKV